MRQNYYILLLVAMLLVSCGGAKTKKQEIKDVAVEHYEPGTRQVDVDFDIYRYTSKEEFDGAIGRYWDGFDFECGERVVEYDTVSVTQAFVDYVAYINVGMEPKQCDSLLRSLMHRAEESRQVLDLFAYVAESVLHDPNSPMRNDELYIPILEVLVESPLYDEYDRIAPAYDLELARQNRIGNVANDIVYTLASGKTGRLHSIDAEYVILMFSNPGCPMCREIIEEIGASPLINEMMENDLIEVLAVYPDEDLEAWRDHIGDIPQSWINGYDDGMRITQERSYNLQAIPSLYLLDSEKRVIIKDGTSVAQIENAIAYFEAM
ncbi:MAG: DUF5106 domain-containing protein [Alistipes sp.]|nr:DUF5106 domain-containing protein [Alistipes sp.]